MEVIKFRQRVKFMSFSDGHVPEKDYWHHWGFLYGKFVSPLNPTEFDERKSYQFINRRDEDNKDIYEGDIIESFPNTNDGKRCVFVVMYSNLAFWGREIKVGTCEWYWMETPENYFEKCKVIGNDCGNPELLKEEEHA